MTKRQINIHTSDIARFKQCRVAWRYASPLGYNREPPKTKIQLLRGSCFHIGLEAFYSGLDYLTVFEQAYIKEVRKERARGAEYTAEEVKEELTLGKTILPIYAQWATKNDRFKVIHHERRLSVPLVETTEAEVFFTFKCDQIIERPKTGLWIHDFKTTASLPETADFLDMNEQITGYLTGAEKYFDKLFTGAMFTYLLTKQPTEPEVLKAGGLSVNKKIYTTPEVFYNAIIRNGLNPVDYRDFIRDLSTRCQWVARFEVIKTKTEKEILWRQHQGVALEMINPNVFIYKAPSQYNCSYCGYKEPCILEHNGRDFETILERNYVNVEPW